MPADAPPRSRRALRIAAAFVGATVVVVFFLDALARSGAGDRSRLTGAMAVLAVAAGVGLIVVGVLLAARRDLRWWRLAAIPAVAVGLFWSVVPLGTAWVATHPRPESPPDQAADVGVTAKAVSLRTADGQRLAAWYLPSENGATLVAFPGARSSKVQLLPRARALAEAGYGVLLVDGRGHGGSTGEAMEYGWYGEADVRAAVDWVSEQPDVRGGRVGAMGLSMGGEQVLTAAAGDPRIRAVIAEGATHRTYEDVRRTLGGVSVLLGVPQYRALFGAVGLMSGAPAPQPLADAMGQIAPRRVLLLNTDAEGDFARGYRAIAPATTDLWLPASDAHIGAFAENPEAWTRRVTGFLGDALAP